MSSTPTRDLAWSQWRVAAYTGKRRDIRLGETFVRADTESQARELGKRALRLVGIRGRYQVSVTQYYPWFDGAFFGYIEPAKRLG